MHLHMTDLFYLDFISLLHVNTTWNKWIILSACMHKGHLFIGSTIDTFLFYNYELYDVLHTIHFIDTINCITRISNIDRGISNNIDYWLIIHVLVSQSNLEVQTSFLYALN